MLTNAKYSRCEYFEVSFSGSLKVLLIVAKQQRQIKADCVDFWGIVVNFVH